MLITFINSYSVSVATKVQNVFTAAKLIAIAIIIVGGMYKLATGNTQYVSNHVLFVLFFVTKPKKTRLNQVFMYIYI